MNHRPLFIFGVARSGTNLLARMLNRHPAVSIALDPLLPLFRSLRNAILATAAYKGKMGHLPPEAPFQDYYFDVYGPFALDMILAGNGLQSLSARALNTLRESIAARAALESPDLASRMLRLTGHDHESVFRSALELIAESKPGAGWAGSKEVWVLEFAPLLRRLFPDAQFIFIERDPRAVIASLLALACEDPTQAAHVPSYLRHWRKQVALARQFERDAGMAGCFHCVSYERLATTPEDTAIDLCRVLGIEFREEMLRLSADGWYGNSSFKHQSRDIYTVTVDRWKSVLPRQLIETADFICGPEMLLTPYRPLKRPQLEHVLECLTVAARQPGSWRSDSGDLLWDFGGELVRMTLAHSDQAHESGLIRRCFLFEETYAAIRAHSRAAVTMGVAA